MAEGIRCPHCSGFTSYAPVMHKSWVELNEPGQWQSVYAASGSVADGATGYFFGTTRCQACGKAFPIRARTSNPDQPDVTVFGTIEPLWPTRYRAVPQEIEKSVRQAMEDASASLGAGSTIGAMLAARTALIRAQRHMKKELSLPESSLKALFDAGRISRFEYESSNLARKWANYLGHDEPDPAKDLSLDDAKELYGYVESLLDSLYVKWASLERQRDNFEVPPTEAETEPSDAGSRQG